MARPWRLRHKLVLGLALVVGSVGLILGGALFGLSSYEQTMRITQRKLVEMQLVTQVRDHVHAIASAGQGGRADADVSQFDRERTQIRDAADKAREALAAYRAHLHHETARRRLDPDAGESEDAQVDRLDQGFARLDAAVARATVGQVGSGTGERLVDDPTVRKAYEDLNRYSTDLFQYLISDVQRSFERSSANHRRSLYVGGSGAALAVILVLTLLYYFRVWVFAPIKLLQAGVARVHRGDFGQPIRLDSKDELEELADEFNAMTARLRDVYADLARQVDERSRQLVAAEKMVSVGFLAAGVAHEINNPMASIAFCAEALERRLQGILAAGPRDADVIVKYLKMIEQEAFRCKQITDRLLNYSRNGTGRREAVDLAGPIQNQLDLLRHHPAYQDRQTVFRHDGPVVATVEAHEIEGVVHNLVVNALEHTDPGGTVAITLRGTPDAAEVVVRDTGCGMTPDVLRHIFEPFFTRSRTGQGNGLGLSICSRVVTEHGGTITASSDGPGRGSTFTVRLPLRAPQPAGDPPPAVLPFAARQPVAA